MPTYELLNADVPLDAEVTSFAGGHPHLPIARTLPACTLCGLPLTFFFQVAFPKDHPWASRSLAVFACTTTWHPHDLIPRLLPERRNVIIPAGFLSTYQTTFRLLVFPTREAVVREEYVPRVRFKPWALKRASSVPVTRHKLGGTPTWRTGVEGPASVAGRPLSFLMQLAGNTSFERLPDAPPMARDPRFAPYLPPAPDYALFVRNVIYFWGTNDDGPEDVYTLVQRP